MSPVSDTREKRKRVKETIPSFALESAGELAKLRTFDAPPLGLFGDTPKQSAKAKPRILFLKGHSVPSALIEESLLRHHYDVSHQETPEKLENALAVEPFDLLLIDHSVSVGRRLALINSVRQNHPELPALLVFPPLADDDVALVTSEASVETLVRDMDGAYLLRIPDRIGQLLSKRKTTQKAESPFVDELEAQDEITETVDLNEVAGGLLRSIGDSTKISLTVLAGPDVGKVGHIGDGAFVIGRDPTCQLQLKDDSISRYHARITKNRHGRLTIEDLGSTNGTFIDGDRIEKQELDEGDKILLGQDSLLKFQKQDAIEKIFHDELYYASTRDGLTNLYNRKYCLEKIGTDLSYARRHALPVSMLIFDVDHFKKVNDTYGHPTGDTVLQAIAELAAKTCRTEDVLGRYGGEEFLIFAMDTDQLGAQVFAERIRDRIENKQIMAIDGSRRLFNATVSIGIATTTDRNCYDFEKLMAEADANLYQAKEKGRNRVIASEVFES